MIAIDHVTYSYPGAAVPVLRNLSLRIAEGEFLLVCGPSGAGKSSLLRLLNGLVPHFYGGRFGGRVLVGGRDTLAHQPRDLADLVGFVFQDPESQFVVDVVEDELVFGMENLGVPQPVMRRRVEEALDQLAIAHLRHRRVSSLSGGERQRVAIAAALCAQPRTLVLDEPTSQLDPHGAEEVLTALQKLNADLGLTIVLCEHRLERVVQYVDRILYLEGTGDRGQGPGGGSEGREDGAGFQIGPAREMLGRIPLVPPLQGLGRALGWEPLPLTIKEGRPLARLAASELRPADVPATSAGRGPGTLPASNLNVRSKPSPPPLARHPRSLARERGPRVEGAQPHRSATSSGRHIAAGATAAALHRVTVRYGEREALYRLSLEARAGELLALMGRNGSGKSTLLKALIGLARPQEGRVEVAGRDIAGAPVEELAHSVGYVPQDPRSILYHDTLREELAFTLRGRPAPAGGPRRAIDGTLEQLGLAHLAGAYPRALSGGEAQRAALAAILAGGPRLLLLDEPTRGLDYLAKEALARTLRELCAQGTAVVMATHDVELAAACADRIALLGDGELVVEGPAYMVLGESLLLSPQIAKLFPGSGWLTLGDALAALRP